MTTPPSEPVQEEAVLKPCPFCGGRAKFGEHRWAGNGALKAHYIHCVKCNVHGYSRNTKEKAIAAWNRRASPSGGLGSLTPRDGPLAEMISLHAEQIEQLDSAAVSLAPLCLQGEDAIWRPAVAAVKQLNKTRAYLRAHPPQNSTVAAQRGEATASTDSGALPMKAAPQVQDGEIPAEMVEAVARAISDACYDAEEESIPGSSIPKSAWPTIARAAIETMEPLIARTCWERINAWIVKGPLPGNGCDQQAQRNGMILATNILFPLAFPQVAAVAAEEQGTPSLGVEPNPPEGGGESQHDVGLKMSDFT